MLGAQRRWAGPAAIAGGVLWLVLRPLVVTTGNTPVPATIVIRP
jgi:hypothetical protein